MDFLLPKTKTSNSRQAISSIQHDMNNMTAPTKNNLETKEYQKKVINLCPFDQSILNEDSLQNQNKDYFFGSSSNQKFEANRNQGRDSQTLLQNPKARWKAPAGTCQSKVKTKPTSNQLGIFSSNKQFVISQEPSRPFNQFHPQTFEDYEPRNKYKKVDNDGKMIYTKSDQSEDLNATNPQQSVIDDNSIPKKKKKKDGGQSKYKFAYSAIPLHIFKILDGIINEPKKECEIKFIDDEDGFKKALEEVVNDYKLDSLYLQEFKEVYIEKASFEKMEKWSLMKGEKNEEKVGMLMTIISAMCVKFIPLEKIFLDKDMEIENKQTSSFIQYLSVTGCSKKNVLLLGKPDFRRHIFQKFQESHRTLVGKIKERLQIGSVEQTIEQKNQNNILNQVLQAIGRARDLDLEETEKNDVEDDLNEESGTHSEELANEDEFHNRFDVFLKEFRRIIMDFHEPISFVQTEDRIKKIKSSFDLEEFARMNNNRFDLFLKELTGMNSFFHFQELARANNRFSLFFKQLAKKTDRFRFDLCLEEATRTNKSFKELVKKNDRFSFPLFFEELARKKDLLDVQEEARINSARFDSFFKELLGMIDSYDLELYLKENRFLIEKAIRKTHQQS